MADAVKKILLTQGKFALVDDKDFKRLNQWKWYAYKHRHTFYAQRYVDGGGGKTVAMHRFILGLKPNDGKITDHINNNGLDNRRHNLRACDSQQNNFNQKARGGSSRFKGVHLHKKTKKWVAVIGYNNKKIHIGLFSCEIEAAIAYNNVAKKLYGEFAYLNRCGGNYE